MSLRKAIDEKRRDCIYDPLSGMGTWRQQVEGCPVETCPLWPVRPRSSAGREPSGNPQPEGLRKWRERKAGENG